jgi:hypothetical protein
MLHFLEGKKWKGTEVNIPCHDFIYMVPVAVHPQAMKEAYRFLQYGMWEIVPLTGKLESRETFWKTLKERTKLGEGNRIIIATHSVSLVHL